MTPPLSRSAICSSVLAFRPPIVILQQRQRLNPQPQLALYCTEAHLLTSHVAKGFGGSFEAAVGTDRSKHARPARMPGEAVVVPGFGGHPLASCIEAGLEALQRGRVASGAVQHDLLIHFLQAGVLLLKVSPMPEARRSLHFLTVERFEAMALSRGMLL